MALVAVRACVRTNRQVSLDVNGGAAWELSFCMHQLKDHEKRLDLLKVARLMGIDKKKIDEAARTPLVAITSPKKTDPKKDAEVPQAGRVPREEQEEDDPQEEERE